MTSRYSKPRGMVSIADALIALDGLRGAELEQAWQWLSGLMGIVRRQSTSSADPEDKKAADREIREAKSSVRERRTQRKTAQRPAGEGDAARDYEISEALLRRSPTLPFKLIYREKPQDPEWLTNQNERLGQAKPFRFSDLPDLEPLLDPKRTRSVIAFAMATSQPDGELDIETILDRVTSRQPIYSLPRRRIPTTRLGLQLLLDRGEAMTPYLRDQEMVAEDIHDVFGDDRVEKLYFTDSPRFGVGTAALTGWKASYRSPPEGTPVVLLTDLGIGRARMPYAGASPGEWLRFARKQKIAGCPLLAMVPYDLARVPSPLRSHFRLLPWSRTTTIAMVRQLIGRGLERIK